MRENGKPVLLLGGDVNLGRRGHVLSSRDALRDVASLRRELGASVCLVNLECVVSDGGVSKVNKGERGPYYFRARPEQLAILIEAGVDIVTTANNHSGDYGPDALLEQLDHLQAAGIAQAGSGATLREAAAPLFFPLGEYTAALFSLSIGIPHFAAGEDAPGTWYMSPQNPELWRETFEPLIAEARRAAHCVFVAPHSVLNASAAPPPEHRAIARALVDAGADAVFGGGTHNLMGVETYRERPIIYATGDLLMDGLSGSTFGSLGDSGMFALRCGPEGVAEVAFYPFFTGRGQCAQARGDRAAQGLADFAAKCALLGCAPQLFPDHAVLTFAPPGGRPAPAQAATPPTRRLPPPARQLTPPARTAPRPEWTSAIPEAARLQEPARLGPLTLLGYAVPRGCRHMTRRGMLWVESWWMAESRPEGEYLLDIQARPEDGKPSPVFGAGMWHQPCDWMWPTSRWEAGVVYRDCIGLRPPGQNELTPTALSLVFKALERRGSGLSVVGEYIPQDTLTVMRTATANATIATEQLFQENTMVRDEQSPSVAADQSLSEMPPVSKDEYERLQQECARLQAQNDSLVKKFRSVDPYASLTQRLSLVPPPPNTIPADMYDRYTLDGKIPVVYGYFDDRTKKKPLFFPEKERGNLHNTARKYAQVFDAINKKTFTYYGYQVNYFYDALKKYSFKDKSVLIWGLAGCNCDALAVWNGASHVYVVDYNKPRCDHEKITVLSHQELFDQKTQTEAGVSYSSFEHDGLGRYGDPLNPEGDLRAMDEARNALVDGGLLFLGLPVGQDFVLWNAHRCYGKLRLPLMLKGWHCIDVYGIPDNVFELPLGKYGQILMVCKKIADDYPDDAVLEQQAYKNQEKEAAMHSPELVKKIASFILEHKENAS